ncbi:hypothetical protein Rt10032_c12g4755 [Rhodotorula toruloides]|uniref:Carboxylesterase type B domain-containing protein n=1 Tax=Rhodotorula toruloides TaxID=5286 RepID=A0A511KK29_RHOTO|nr:hypothetical protein Rt10032_c12g4755 [Rhodotorula toruloides]
MQRSPVTLPARNNGAPTANIKNGTVQGVALPTFSQEAFLGVPFAQPPVGDLRLRKPHSLNTTFSGVPRVGGDDWPYELSEDCLYLNVLRPAGTKKGDKLPIGVWIYGGGTNMGGSGDSHNGSWVVERSVEMGKPIMFVSINYRVAALGFMASEKRRKEGNVNLGLYDQRLALHWVWNPIVDGEIISACPSDTLAKDDFVRVPMLIGANTDEGTAFSSKYINATEQLAANLHLCYPAMTSASDKRSDAIYGDMYMQAGRRLLAEKMAKYRPVYSYRFDQPAENSTIQTGNTSSLAWVLLGYSTPNNNKVSDVPTWPNYQDEASNYVFRRHGCVTEKDDYRKEGMSFIDNLSWEASA